MPNNEWTILDRIEPFKLALAFLICFSPSLTVLQIQQIRRWKVVESNEANEAMAQAIQPVPVALETSPEHACPSSPWNVAGAHFAKRFRRTGGHPLRFERLSGKAPLIISTAFIMFSNAFWCFLMLSAYSITSRSCQVGSISCHLLLSEACIWLYLHFLWFSAASTWGFRNIIHMLHEVAVFKKAAETVEGFVNT